MSYLLDTNAVIDYLDASLPELAMQLLGTIVDENSSLSIITKIEALGFNFKSIKEQSIMEIFINSSDVLDINNDIANKTIAIRKSLKKSTYLMPLLPRLL